jgi:sporulation protein YlmC with PRC-barrel domain
MRTLSSLQQRKVETESGRALGRCHDLRGQLTDNKLRVTGLCVGPKAWPPTSGSAPTTDTR